MSSQESKNEIGIYSSDDIVEHDAGSPAYRAVHKSGGKWFYYIEKTEEKESPDDD